MTLILRLAPILLLFSAKLVGQVTFSQKHIDLGKVGAVYEISGDVVIRNEGDTRVHLLRAKAEDGVTVFTSKRTLQPNDTALLVIAFQPTSAGRFSKAITLFTSEEIASHKLSISGDIESVRKNDLTACYYFGSRPVRSPRVQKEAVLVQNNIPAKRPDSHGLGNIDRPRVTHPAGNPRPTKPAATVTPVAPTGSLHAHVPNNIVLLIDISSSMRDSLKLPLMKLELNQLIDAIRDVDSISLVTYNDSVKVRAQALSGKEKEQLHAIVNGLKARGMTKGKKAILQSQDLAQRHYITGGNNLLILASDGEFRFTEEDQQTWQDRQSKGAITITTVAFGNDKEALRTLKHISSKGGGSFIHITRRKDATARLLQEVELRSRPPGEKR